MLPAGRGCTRTKGQPYTNFVRSDPYTDPKEGDRQRTSTGSGFVRLHPQAADKTIGHEMAGQGSELEDVYDYATLRPNPRMPNNLMNNDDFTDAGMKLDWQQVETIKSPTSGNDVIQGEPGFWRKVRDFLGF
jgi:hypothetical protein